MDLLNIFGVALAFIGSLGGGAAIVAGVSSWLGKLWAEQFMEKERAKHAQSLEEIQHKHSQELEKLKTEFARELEHYRSELSRVSARFERYDARQFETYGRIWEALYDLKLAADDLWTSATRKNVSRISQQLQETFTTTGKLSLYIEEAHYAELRDLLYAFSDFQIGKQKLIEYRNDRAHAREYDEDLVRRQIHSNYQIKERYDSLIEKIRNSFKAHMSVPLYTAAPTNSTRTEEKAS